MRDNSRHVADRNLLQTPSAGAQPRAPARRARPRRGERLRRRHGGRCRTGRHAQRSLPRECRRRDAPAHRRSHEALHRAPPGCALGHRERRVRRRDRIGEELGSGSRRREPRDDGAREGLGRQFPDRSFRDRGRGERVALGLEPHEGSSPQDLRGRDQGLEGRRRDSRGNQGLRPRAHRRDAPDLRRVHLRWQGHVSDRLHAGRQRRLDDEGAHLVQGLGQHADDHRGDAEGSDDQAPVARWGRAQQRETRERHGSDAPTALHGLQPHQAEARDHRARRIQQEPGGAEAPDREVIQELLRPGLLRRLVTRTVGWSAIALLAFALPAFIVSNQLIVSRFEDEAKSLGATADRGVTDRVTLAGNAAATIAGLPDVSQLVQSNARTSQFAQYLLPVKSRLRLDVLYVASPTGEVIGGAQDFPPGLTLPPELLRRAGIRAEEAWVIEDEPAGLTVYAISVVRGTNGVAIGFVESGLVLNTAVLTSIKQSTDPEMVILFRHSVLATTLARINTGAFPTVAETALTPDARVTRQVDAGGQP